MCVYIYISKYIHVYAYTYMENTWENTSEKHVSQMFSIIFHTLSRHLLICFTRFPIYGVYMSMFFSCAFHTFPYMFSLSLSLSLSLYIYIYIIDSCLYIHMIIIINRKINV